MNCMHVGWAAIGGEGAQVKRGCQFAQTSAVSHLPDLPQLVQETILSGLEFFLLQLLSPKQKSQYGLGLASTFPSTLGGGGSTTGTLSSAFPGGETMVMGWVVLGVGGRERTP